MIDLCTDCCAGQLNEAELDNQGLQAQLEDITTRHANLTTAQEQLAAQKAELDGNLEEERSLVAKTSAELESCRAQVGPQALSVHLTYDYIVLSFRVLNF